MIQEVKYTKTVYSKAGRKYPTQVGLVITGGHSYFGGVPSVKLEAVNDRTKTVTTHLFMEIPKENLQDVIDKLKTFL